MFGAIPFEVDVNVFSAVPVRLHWAAVADELLKLQCVVLVDILDPKSSSIRVKEMG